MDKKLLKMTLTSGSSKVFNCLAITRDVSTHRTIQDSDYLFSVRALNYGVFFKEPTDKSWNASVDAAVDTLLYFPYNAEQLAEGGASVSLNDSRFDAVVKEFTQAFGSAEHKNAANDRAILNVLRESPSLDPYLLKSAFQRNGIEVPDTYLKISEEEWATIREYVRQKLRPMIEFGIDPRSKRGAEKLEEFVDKIWDGSDVSSLFPLLEALQINLDEASEVVFAWKGLTFFEHQYERKLDMLKKWAYWLKENAKPTDAVRYEMRSQIEARRDETRRLMRRHWHVVVTILDEYKHAYHRLFIAKAGAGEFQHFLKNCKKNYLTLGASLNRLDHAMEIVDRSLKGDAKRMLRSDELEELFQCLTEVLR